MRQQLRDKALCRWKRNTQNDRKETATPFYRKWVTFKGFVQLRVWRHGQHRAGVADVLPVFRCYGPLRQVRRCSVRRHPTVACTEWFSFERNVWGAQSQTCCFRCCSPACAGA